MDFNDWTKPEEKTSQGYGNDYYQNPQQGYGNDYYRNPQQQQYYNNTGYQDPMMDDRFSQPDFNNSGYSREELYAEKRRKAQEIGQNLKNSGVGSIVFVTWCIVSVMAGLLLSTITHHPGWSITCFGQMFAGIGIMIFVKEKSKSENMILLIFPIAGILLTVAGLISVFWK